MSHSRHTRRIAAGLAALALAGCAGPGGPGAHPGAFYRCENGIEFRARFVDGSALLDGPGGRDVLERKADAPPGASVYRNPRMQAEFNLGASGREAVLRYPLLPLVARCVRDEG